jgi:hypothetical protein
MSVTIFGMPLLTPSVSVQAVELAELLDLGAGVPADALAAVAQLVHQRAQRGEALVDVRVVALDHAICGAVLPGIRSHSPRLPVLHVEGLGQFAGGVVHHRRQHHLLSTPRWPTQTSLNFLAKPL